MNIKPNITIILPTCGDKEPELRQTIDSLLVQKYLNWDLLIIDAGDCGIVNSNKIKIIKCPPRGISDAFNKGIKVAKGEYLYFIGAGDYFWSEDVLEKMMKNVDPEKDMLVCGKIKRVSEDGKNVLYTSSLDFKKWMLLYKMGLPHQALFTNRKFFDKYGLFDLNCKYAMDYELLLRSYSSFPKLVMKNVVVAAWREGGVGKNKIGEVLSEYHRIRLKNKIAPKVLLDFIYLISKLRYRLKND